MRRRKRAQESERLEWSRARAGLEGHHRRSTSRVSGKFIMGKEYVYGLEKRLGEWKHECMEGQGNAMPGSAKTIQG